MSDYKLMFEKDRAYQDIINQFKESKETIINATKTGVVDGVAVVGTLNKVAGDLKNNIRDYRENKLKEIDQKQDEIIKNYQQDIDYTSNTAKQFEVKFNLAEDHELQTYVNELETDDFLYINLLRLELKKRGLSNLDRIVKNHVITLEGEYAKDEQYKELTEQRATLNTMGSNVVIIDGEFYLIDNVVNNLTNEIREIAKSTNGKERKDHAKVLQDMQKYTQALQQL